MALDPTIQQLFEEDLAAGVRVFRGELDLAHRRQADGAAQDMRVTGGFLMQNLFASDLPEVVAGLNTGVRTPTTISQPSSGVIDTGVPTGTTAVK